MLTVLSLDESKTLIKENFSGLFHLFEEIDLAKSYGRVLFEDVFSNSDMPSYRRSTVDGYAIKARDSFGANDATPAIFALKFEVEMGKKPEQTIQNGEAAYVPTGGYVPQGADCVCMIEHTGMFGKELLIYKSVSPSSNIIFKGDDTKKGEKILEKGKILSHNDIGALSALGICKLKVTKKLRSGIISTGDEMVPANTVLEEESPLIRDVNANIATSMLTEWGFEAINFGICRDDYIELQALVQKAYTLCDVVIISGGSSVGQKDNTAKIISEMEHANILIHGIAMKPGKPTIIAKAQNKALIGLPGHPVSAFFILLKIVKPLLFQFIGAKIPPAQGVYATLNTNVSSNHGRDEMIPVALTYENEKAIATPVIVKSGLIALLTKSDGYFTVPRSSEGINIGETVFVEML